MRSILITEQVHLCMNSEGTLNRELLTVKPTLKSVGLKKDAVFLLWCVSKNIFFFKCGSKPTYVVFSFLFPVPFSLFPFFCNNYELRIINYELL